MRRITLALTTALSLLFGILIAAQAGEHYPAAPYQGSTEFERIRQLAGIWEGTANMGKPGDRVQVEYRVTAGGSAVVETLFPGSGEEMVSVYTDRDAKLAMTHYCMLRNQPRMTLAKADAHTIELVFSKKGNDINPAREKHMHAVRFNFTDNDHIVQTWTLYDKGKDAGMTTLQLTRVQ
jgi:hypothetical protein